MASQVSQVPVAERHYYYFQKFCASKYLNWCEGWPSDMVAWYQGADRLHVLRHGMKACELLRAKGLLGVCWKIQCRAGKILVWVWSQLLCLFEMVSSANHLQIHTWLLSWRKPVGLLITGSKQTNTNTVWMIRKQELNSKSGKWQCRHTYRSSLLIGNSCFF